ncbi:MAG: histidine kinase dimerization/phospho-acceptor domain-containing protein [Thomasclavelia sp.]
MKVGRKAKLKNGKEKWIQYKFLPIIDEDGKAIKRIGILTDITKEVALEEEKEKIRLDFFANISHELRTPVNLILSSIQVLKLKLRSTLRYKEKIIIIFSIIYKYNANKEIRLRLSKINK